MKIMVVNNNALFEKNNGLFLYKETGKFLVELLKSGDEVVVFQFRMKFKGRDFLADYDITGKGLNIISVKRRNLKLVAYLKASLVGFLTVRNVDFVYLFYPSSICKILAYFCLILSKKYGFYVRGEYGLFSSTNKYLYSKAHVVFTISPKFTDIIKEIGASVSTIRPMMEFSEKDIWFNRVYSQKPSYEFLYVGRLERAKGQYELLEAICILIEQGITNFTLHLVGDGEDASALKEIVIKNNLLDYVKFHGTITNRNILASFYKKADLFIFPSYHEGFPRVLYEAMIFGVPIITTFVGGISYLLKEGYNCHKIEPKDIKGLVIILKKVIDDYHTYSQVAINGKSTISTYLLDKKEDHASQLLRAIKP